MTRYLSYFILFCQLPHRWGQPLNPTGQFTPSSPTHVVRKKEVVAHHNFTSQHCSQILYGHDIKLTAQLSLSPSQTLAHSEPSSVIHKTDQSHFMRPNLAPDCASDVFRPIFFLVLSEIRASMRPAGAESDLSSGGSCLQRPKLIMNLNCPRHS